MPVLTIEVDQLHQGPIELTATMTPAQFELLDDPEFRFDHPIEVHFTARLVGRESVGLRGTVSTSVVAECVRCLGEVRISLVANLDLVFLKRPAPGTPEARDWEEDDEKIWYRGDVVYPLEQLREELLINLPFLPTCELETGQPCAGGRDQTAEEAPGAKSEATNAWQAQLAKVRKKLGDHG